MTSQSEAITFAVSNELDYDKLAIALASSRPGLLLELLAADVTKLGADLLVRDPELFLRMAKTQVANLERTNEILSALKVDGMVSAIKVLREVSGLGLKEAKDVIVTLRDTLVARGIIPCPNPVKYPMTAAKLDANLQSIHDGLVAAMS